MLKGTLDDFTLPDIFRLMSLAKRIGALEVQRSAGSGKVYFRDGEVYFAESSLARTPLGQKLVSSGVITETQLMKALDIHKEMGPESPIWVSDKNFIREPSRRLDELGVILGKSPGGVASLGMAAPPPVG